MGTSRRWLWLFLGSVAFGVWTFAVWTHGLEYGRNLSKGLPPLRVPKSVPVEMAIEKQESRPVTEESQQDDTVRPVKSNPERTE